MPKVILAVIFILLFPCLALCYTVPSTLEVTKPTPGNTLHVGAGQTYASIDEAEAAVSCGDEIVIHAGSYGNFVWTTNCTEGNEVVILAAGDGDAVFYPLVDSECRIDGAYLIMDGGANKELVFDGSGITANSYILRAGASHTTLYRCEFRAGGEDNPGNGQFHIGTGGDYSRIYNCYLHDGFSGGIYIFDGDYVEVKNNEVMDHDGSGIQWNAQETGYHSDGVVISGNAVRGNGALYTKPGIAILSSANNAGYGIQIYNNLLWGNLIGIRKTEYASQTNIDAEIYNNSVYGSIGANFLIEAGGSATIRNNTSSGGGASDSYAGTYVLSDIELSPSYMSVDDTNDNFLKLTASNPGYDTNPPVTIDYAGEARDATAPDIGAFEYATLTAPTVTITTESGQTVSNASFTVAGIAEATDGRTITGVSVNGTSATSSDGFATWTATITLSSGSQTVTATATDSESETNTAIITVTLETPAASGVVTVGYTGTSKSINYSGTAQTVGY